MSPRDLAASALGNLGRRKARTTLTVVGVVVGAAAMVLLLSLAQGMRASVLDQFAAEEGLSYVFIMRTREPIDPTNLTEDVDIADLEVLTSEDLERMQAVEGVAHAAPHLHLNVVARLEEGESSRGQHVEGVPQPEADRLAAYLAAGEFWSDGIAMECVVPMRLLEKWEIEDPAGVVGRTLHLEHPLLDPPVEVPLRIAGVIDSERVGLIRRNHVFVSTETWIELEEKTRGGMSFFGLRYDPENPRFPAAYARVADPARLEAVSRGLREAGFQAFTALDAVEGVKRIFALIEAVFFMLGGIGLVVAVFGIANTMSMNVLERTREIGIMKAVGATNGTVLGLFLAEAGMIGLVGGAIGLAGGWVGGRVLSALAHLSTEVPEEAVLFRIPWWLALGALALSVVVSVGAGLLPARRAARMRPAAALRYE